MPDAPIEEAARRLWDMGQRIAVQIAEKPRERRDDAFAVAERTVRDLASQMGVAKDKTETFVGLQMRAIRQFVAEIDIGGSPQGGSA